MYKDTNKINKYRKLYKRKICHQQNNKLKQCECINVRYNKYLVMINLVFKGLY